MVHRSLSMGAGQPTQDAYLPEVHWIMPRAQKLGKRAALREVPAYGMERCLRILRVSCMHSLKSLIAEISRLERVFPAMEEYMLRVPTTDCISSK